MSIIKISFYIISAIIVFSSCGTSRVVKPTMQRENNHNVVESKPANSALLQQLLSTGSAAFVNTINRADSHKIQIIYTQIDRDASNAARFTHHYFRVNNEYTYPASTIKLPAAALALEKLNNLAIPGLHSNSPMLTQPVRLNEPTHDKDVSSQSGRPSIAHHIKKVLLVSDNESFNRLYEFLGQETFNQRLHDLGFTNAQMTHRLSVALSEAENRTTNAIVFTDEKGEDIYRQPAALSKWTYAERNDKVGNGYMAGGKLIIEPLDFSNKNRWSLDDIHRFVQYIMFPWSHPAATMLNLIEDDYHLLRKYMSMHPGESTWPKYQPEKQWPSYVKFLLAGSEKGAWPYPNVRIFNKVGNAYGFLLDGAYVADFENKVEFMLSAVIYCNSDGILNDDKYDYESIGFPFMKELGEIIYKYERSRPQSNIPDLEAFKYDYTKED